jgi:predicted ribosomally synthesized peptide with SipW-like signal peptide
MKSIYFLCSLFSIIGIGFLFHNVTHSYFTDTATTNSNVFAAALVFPTTMPSPAPTINITPTPTIGLGSVVINEINWAGSAASGADEWIELRNTTNNPINITNWVIRNLGGGGVNADITLPSGIIPANGFFLVSNYDHTDSSSKLNIPADYFTTYISLSDGGEQLTLFNNLGDTIDIANGTGGWFFPANSLSPKKSMERKSPPGDGVISTNWQSATAHINMDGSSVTDEFGSPKAANP